MNNPSLLLLYAVIVSISLQSAYWLKVHTMATTDGSIFIATIPLYSDPFQAFVQQKPFDAFF